MTKKIQLGLLGCGVVGGGVVETIWRNHEYILENHDLQFNIAKIVVQNVDRKRTEHTNKDSICSDWRLVSCANDIDVVIEAMGGISPAYEAVKECLQSGKHVVTANKELLAVHGMELHELASRKGVRLLCEASTLGGIPALHTLTGYFQGNRITSLVGVVNGTCNYILTQMEQEKQSFAQAMSDAKNKGYAEADPSADVEGWDALYKLKILVRHALKVEFDTTTVKRLGILGVTPFDIDVARVLDCKIKHVVMANYDFYHSKLEVSVAPVFIAKKHPLYGTDGVNNALLIGTSSFGDYLLVGPGAGRFPTAGAIIEDLISVFRQTPVRTTSNRVVQAHPVHHPEFVIFEKHSSYQFRDSEWALLMNQLQALNNPQNIVQLNIPNIRIATVQPAPTAQAQYLELANRWKSGNISCYPLYRASALEE